MFHTQNSTIRRLAAVAVAGVAGIGLALGTALPASAHDKAADVDCATASVSLTNYDQGATALITLDGVVLHDGTFDGRLVTGWPTGGNVEHTFTVVVASADGDRYNMDFAKTTVGCFVPPVVPACPVYDFPSQKMWEITWGYSFEDRNGGAPLFTMQSNGGLTGLNGGPVPTYMTADWHWLYVTGDRVVSYQFADGTERTATVTGTDCTPQIVWTVTPPVVVVPPVDPPVEELPPALPLTDVPTLADTGVPASTVLVFLAGLGALLVFAGSRIIRKRVAS